MKKNFTLICLLLISTQLINAQVAKKVVVEHFTNTKCGICSSRNPGFYKNLKNFPDVLHLSIHPSSPYATCKLSQQNNPDNDDRTKYYNIYGGTPRLVIQGKVISANEDYNSSTLFSSEENQISSLSIKIEQSKFGTDSLHAKITITAEAAFGLDSLRLFVALAEDTVFYQGSNGEPQHYDVYRASLFGATGTTVAVPTVKGQSLVYEATVPGNSIWDMNRIYTMAILQNSASKAIVQAEAASPKDNFTTAVLEPVASLDFNIYPNPANDLINVELKNNEVAVARLLTFRGDLIGKYTFNSTIDIPISYLPKGIYLIEVKQNGLSLLKKFTKE